MKTGKRKERKSISGMSVAELRSMLSQGGKYKAKALTEMQKRGIK